MNMSNHPMKAVLYARQSPSPKSREEKRLALAQNRSNASLSLETQLLACRAQADRKGYAVIGEFSDPALSGKDTIEGRPGLQAVLELAAKNPDVVVIVYNLSRLARRQSLTIMLLDDRGDYRLQLESATESFDTTTPMGRAMIGMLSVFAQLQVETISENTVAALATLRGKGIRLGARPLSLTRPDDALEIQRLYHTGRWGTRALAEHLNAIGMPGPRGGKWHATTIRRILKDDVLSREAQEAARHPRKEALSSPRDPREVPRQGETDPTPGE
jgi:site-specific DNA recombinase